ncbi:unnamed protein product [Fraxinus pennsylvanica]|uniref:Homeobox domain-containing protein n=1 Tax=Fraxinus pennsylvanica TaxID=56036 RepID=A0AAD1YMC7_9LAMI|nr:unnamed protein product [Fraxinus pennsylvanica]
MAKRFEKHQNDALELAFEESVHLTKEKKIELVRATGLDMEQVTSWFNRKKARKRARESIGDLERTNAELHQALKESQEKEARLQRELQESRVREAELEAKNQQLKQRLTIIEGDVQFDSVLKFLKGRP